MSHRAFFLMLSLVTFAACQRPASKEVPATTPGTAAPETPSGLIFDAQRALDGLDKRVAVPLLPMMANHQKENMRDHLLAVQEIAAAAAGDDFAGIERAAARIGYSEQMGRMCTHMGAGAPGFTEQALKFHRTADEITTAARRRDRSGVMGALAATLQTCTACHAVYRQQVVDEDTWARVASAPAPSGHGARP